MRERVRRIEGIGIVFWRKQLKLMISKEEMYVFADEKEEEKERKENRFQIHRLYALVRKFEEENS